MPRRLHSETSFSMSMMACPCCSRGMERSGSGPVTGADAHGADLDAQRVAPEFRHQGELVHARRGADVVIISQRVQAGAPAAQAEGALEHPAVVLEAVPGDAGAVVELD